MNIHLRTQNRNSEHERITVFVNGKNAGELCMSPRECGQFAKIVKTGCYETGRDENHFERTERRALAEANKPKPTCGAQDADGNFIENRRPNE